MGLIKNEKVMKYVIIVSIILVLIIIQISVSKKNRSFEKANEERFTNIIEFEKNGELLLDSPIVSDLVVHDGLLYLVTKNSTIYIVDMKSKGILKEISLSSKRIYDKGLVVNKGYIFLADKTYIVIIDINNESIVYENKVALHSIDKILVSEDLLYYSYDGIIVHAIGLDAFEIIWSQQEKRDRASTFPIIDGHSLYYKGINDRVVKVDKKTGQILQSFELKNLHPHFIIDENYIFGRELSKSIYKVDKESGNIIWQISGRPSTPVVDDYNLYYFDFDEFKVIALDKESAKIIWKQDTLNITALTYMSSSKFVFIRRDDGKIIGVNKFTGERLWELLGFDGEYFQMEIFDDALILADKNGTVNFYDVSTEK